MQWYAVKVNANVSESCQPDTEHYQVNFTWNMHNLQDALEKWKLLAKESLGFRISDQTVI